MTESSSGPKLFVGVMYFGFRVSIGGMVNLEDFFISKLKVGK